MEVQVIVFFVLLGLAAVFDYKKRELPDWITCLLWFNAIAMISVPALIALSLSFPMLWGINLAFFHLKGKQFLGWGDVLIFPPFFAQLYAWGLPIFAILGLFMPMIYGGLRKKQEEEFIAPYLLFMAIAACFFKASFLN